MDLKNYYQKIHEQETKIGERFAILASTETPDGGKPGILTEVATKVAAKMVVDGVARLATPEETRVFREHQAEAVREAEQAAASSKVQLTVLPSSELERLKAAVRPMQD
jgi:hypothetical protein